MFSETQPINNLFLRGTASLAPRLRKASCCVEQRRTMAANCARRTLQIASASAKTLSSRTQSSSLPFASKASKLSGQFSVEKRIFFRLPVELAGVQQSLMPLHSVTASALFNSLLSLQNHNWGCLSEGDN
ncbi:hypothetical protein CJ030_MR0G006352 [Morella rubra]|uniref:Protein NUCLEAR FUSION DEFECTIVE 6, chloroplastic/mitochondrial n=1 Tax=Morella rubra TaxID=262757 RepID=A0A6A1UKS2_9ROSI|nr:hypothetical protein CJ030_MR0G006352 [Morella rubra]